MNTKTKMSAKDIFQYTLAAIIVTGEIVMIGFLMNLWKNGASTNDQAIVNLIYGIAMAYHSGFMMVLGYFFMSNKGSAEKTAMIHNSTPVNPPNE